MSSLYNECGTGAPSGKALGHRLNRPSSISIGGGLKIFLLSSVFRLTLEFVQPTIIYEGHPESKERLHIPSAHQFCCSQSLISDVQCDVENCLMQLYVGPCLVVNAEIAVAMAVSIEIPAACEVRGVIRFLQADEILGYLAKEASSCV